MRTRILFTTLFAIMLFAVAANAQHVKAFDGTGNSHSLSPSRSTAIPTLDAVHGKPIKIVIDTVETRKSTPKLLEAAVKGKVFKVVPCSSGAVAMATKTSTDKVEVRMQYELENALISSYSISGQEGSCRLFSMRLPNGAEYFAKLRFVR